MHFTEPYTSATRNLKLPHRLLNEDITSYSMSLNILKHKSSEPRIKICNIFRYQCFVVAKKKNPKMYDDMKI